MSRLGCGHGLARGIGKGAGAFRAARTTTTTAATAPPRPPEKKKAATHWEFGRFLRTLLFFNPPGRALSGALASLTGAAPPPPAPPPPRGGATAALFDAADAACPLREWGALDDVVMGGRSSSGFTIVPGAGEGGAPAGVFAGDVTAAGGGGFASTRSRNAPAPGVDLSAAAGLALRVRGDGCRYKCVVRTEPAWDGMGYTASFDTPADGRWATVRLPWAAFAPVFRARTVAGAPPLDAARVVSVQLMLSKFDVDGRLNPAFREGEFELRVARIGGYAPA